MRGNAVRDLAALNKVEMLPWDEWGRMTASYAGETGPEYDALISELAAVCAADDRAAIADAVRPGRLRSPAGDDRLTGEIRPPLRGRTYVRYGVRMGAAALPPQADALPPEHQELTLPRRDHEARTRLRAAAARAAPAVLARDRLLTVADPLGALLPAGGVQRGSTVALDGPPGAGSTTIACSLAAAATSAGEWAAVVDLDGTFGARAAGAAAVALERCAVVRHVPLDRWSTVVAALLDGVALVVATVPSRLRAGEARRLTARARERASVLVALGEWPAEASLRLHARGGAWTGLEQGLLVERVPDVLVESKEMPKEASRRLGFARGG